MALALPGRPSEWLPRAHRAAEARSRRPCPEAGGAAAEAEAARLRVAYAGQLKPDYEAQHRSPTRAGAGAAHAQRSLASERRGCATLLGTCTRHRPRAWG